MNYTGFAFGRLGLFCKFQLDYRNYWNNAWGIYVYQRSALTIRVIVRRESDLYNTELQIPCNNLSAYI